MSFALASAPQRKRENAPPQRRPSQAQAPHARDDGNVGAEQVENPGSAPELAMARVVSHSVLQVAAPGAAADDANGDDERKQGEEDDEMEMSNQIHNPSFSTKDLACVMKGCRGQFCHNKYGHPNTRNPREKGKYYCQYAKGCEFQKSGGCFNSHFYWWQSDESPQFYVCQFYANGKCWTADDRCTMFHPQIEGSSGNKRQIQFQFRNDHLPANPIPNAKIQRKRENERFNEKKENECVNYTTDMISCPGTKPWGITCKEYTRRTCRYGHCPLSDVKNGSLLFCAFGRRCNVARCTRNHSFDWNMNDVPKQLKCPWEAGQGQCKFMRCGSCPFYHNGSGSADCQRKWKENMPSYGSWACDIEGNVFH